MLRAALLAALVLGASSQDPIVADGEDLSTDNRHSLLAEVNSYRMKHGACDELTWDDKLAADVKAFVKDGDVCKDADAAPEDMDGYEAYITTFNAGDPAPTFTPSFVAEEWYGAASGKSFENLAWTSHTKVGCAKCRLGMTNEGHMVHVFCKYSDDTGANRQGPKADNIYPEGTLCDRCLAVVCQGPAPCKQAGVCNKATGICEYPSQADGVTCDDNNDLTKDDVCTSGTCAGVSLCHNVVCGASSECEASSTCNEKTGKCEATFKQDGTPCDDKDPKTVDDVCTNGVCFGTDHCVGVTCKAEGQCHTVGVCDHATGVCSTPFKAKGEVCDDMDDKTQYDTCDGKGVCQGQDLCENTQCFLRECVESSYCNPKTGLCEELFLKDDHPCNGTAGKCQGGTCELPKDACDGVDCTPDPSPSNCQLTGVCVLAGRITPGCVFTYKVPGADCDDGDDKTTSDKCVASSANPDVTECRGTDLCANMDCPEEQCRKAGTCQHGSGLCSHENKPDGTTCDDQNPDTADDQCTNGICQGVDKCKGVDCSKESTQCVDKYCEPATGQCTELRFRPDGAPCDDSHPATILDQCEAGVCTGTNKCDGKVCTQDGNPCQNTIGSCDRSTGECTFLNKADGDVCDDGKANTFGDKCTAGECKPGTNCEVELISEWSVVNGTCIFGTSYGFTAAGNFFVDMGCRGEFKIVANNHILQCISEKWQYTECGTSPLLPGCTDLTPAPCPAPASSSVAEPCYGYTRIGDGFCVDSQKKLFDYLSVETASLEACIAWGRNKEVVGKVVGVEWWASQGRCNLLVPDGKVSDLSAIKGISITEKNEGVPPVTGTDGKKDAECWVPEDRCLGVVCKAKDSCHDAGVCQKQTGQCSNPMKPSGTFCDDGNDATWGDACRIADDQKFKCVGHDSQKRCFVANSWGSGVRTCVEDKSACNWGSGVYPSEEECCKHSFVNGCQSKAKTCWVGNNYWPKRTCKEVSGDRCSLPLSSYSTHDDCCARGAAHRWGCSHSTRPRVDDGVADRPEQCVCDKSLYGPGMNSGIDNYCASKSEPNGNGHACSLAPLNKDCGSKQLFCRKDRSVPTSAGQICACGSLLNGAKNTHSRLCCAPGASGMKNCYPSNSNGQCSQPTWTICFSKVGFQLSVRTGLVSSKLFAKAIAKLALLSVTKVKVVSSCTVSVGISFGSSFFGMSQSGKCTMSSWSRKFSRSAATLEDEESTVTFQMEGSASEQNEAMQNLNENLDILHHATDDEKEALFKKDPEMVETMKDAKSWVVPKEGGALSTVPAITGEGESEEEISGAGDEEEDNGFLVPLLASLGGAACLIAVASAFFVSRGQGPHSPTHSDSSESFLVQELTTDVATAPASEQAAPVRAARDLEI